MNSPSIPPHRGSSGNALKHGLEATDPIFLSRLSADEQAILERLRDMLFTQHQPQSSVEELIVDKIAIHLYRQYRFYRLEHQTINAGMNLDSTGLTMLPHLDRLSRYDSRINHHLNTLYQSLRAAQRNRKFSLSDSQDKNQPSNS